jgi:hypothetical protein
MRLYLLAVCLSVVGSVAVAHEWVGPARDYPFLPSGTPGDVLDGRKTVPEVIDNGGYLTVDVYEWLAHLHQAMVDEIRAMKGKQ